jgi:hypothetical protein
LLILAALILSACGGDPNEVGEFQPYVSDAFGFRVDYPSNWQAVVDPEFLVGQQPDALHAVVFLRDQTAGVAFTVLIQKLSSEAPLELFVEQQMDAIRMRSTDVVYSDPAEARLAGQAARETNARLEQGGQSITQRVIMAVKGDRGYGVSLSGPAGSSLIPVLERMLETFAFLP